MHMKNMYSQAFWLGQLAVSLRGYGVLDIVQSPADQPSIHRDGYS